MSKPLRALAASFLLASLSSAQELTGDTAAVNSFAGGSQELSLDAGPAFAGEAYLIVGSLTGTTPGITLPGTSLVLPLNFDFYTRFLAVMPNTVVQGSLGVLDSEGRASATFVQIPFGDPNLIDLVVNHAYLIVSGSDFVGVSNAVPATLSVEGSLAVEFPANGAEVGTATIDVEGRLPASMSGVSGVTVTVDGVPAIVSPSASGFDRFVAPEVRLAAGSNTLSVVASGPGMPTRTTNLAVDHQLLNANNVALRDGFAYAALGSPGVAIVDLETRGFVVVPPPAGSGSIDDLSIDGDLLFALDGDGPGRLSVFDLSDATSPALVSGPIAVPVGPFAGVSAAGGRVVTSGGTSLLRVYGYSPTGVLTSGFGSIDLGIGQPDVITSADGAQAFVSTDFAGTFDGAGFGITVLDLLSPPTDPLIDDRIGIPGSGFTAGFQSPANFPVESALAGDYVLTAFGGGLAVLQSGVGTTVATLGLGFAGTNVDAVDDRAYVVGQAPARRLATVDISDPSSPSVVGTRAFAGPGAFSGVASNGDVVVIAANGGGILVVAAD